MDILLFQYLLDASGSIPALMFVKDILNHFCQRLVFNGAVAFSALEIIIESRT